jgi:hypothetical protein
LFFGGKRDLAAMESKKRPLETPAPGPRKIHRQKI